MPAQVMAQLVLGQQLLASKPQSGCGSIQLIVCMLQTKNATLRLRALNQRPAQAATAGNYNSSNDSRQLPQQASCQQKGQNTEGRPPEGPTFDQLAQS